MYVSHFYFFIDYWFISFACLFLFGVFQNVAEITGTTTLCIIVVFISSPRFMGEPHGAQHAGIFGFPMD